MLYSYLSYSLLQQQKHVLYSICIACIQVHSFFVSTKLDVFSQNIIQTFISTLRNTNERSQWIEDFVLQMYT